jgi:hypothetical protein
MLARSLRFAACFDAYGAAHLSVFIKLQVGDRNLRPFVLKIEKRFLAKIEGKIANMRLKMENLLNFIASLLTIGAKPCLEVG